jgi:hypothetical protein
MIQAHFTPFPSFSPLFLPQKGGDWSPFALYSGGILFKERCKAQRQRSMLK